MIWGVWDYDVMCLDCGLKSFWQKIRQKSSDLQLGGQETK
jgi:hypothetical protein